MGTAVTTLGRVGAGLTVTAEGMEVTGAGTAGMEAAMADMGETAVTVATVAMAAVTMAAGLALLAAAAFLRLAWGRLEVVLTVRPESLSTAAVRAARMRCSRR